MIVRANKVEPSVTVTLDGREVQVPAGTTILSALRTTGKDVPTLCYSDRMEP